MSMRHTSERVTVTLPAIVVQEIDRFERNRSKFVLGAVEREIQRRRREALHCSLRKPHPESDKFADFGLEEWGRELPEDEVASLVDLTAGTALQWVPDQGWSERE